MSVHADPHPLAGKNVTIASGKFKGEKYHIEDYWDRVAGASWKCMVGNAACMEYAWRANSELVPLDNEVLYGKIDPFGKLIHVSQIGEEV